MRATLLTLDKKSLHWDTPRSSQCTMHNSSPLPPSIHPLSRSNLSITPSLSMTQSLSILSPLLFMSPTHSLSPSLLSSLCHSLALLLEHHHAVLPVRVSRPPGRHQQRLQVLVLPPQARHTLLRLLQLLAQGPEGWYWWGGFKKVRKVDTR